MDKELIEMVNQGQYERVLMELEQYDINSYTEEMIIIAVSSLLALGNYEKAQKYLQLGLQINGKSDELYLLLGNYYERYNLMQAYLCYENAEFYCHNMQDREIIRVFKKRIEEENRIRDRKLSIILLNNDCSDRIRYCIENIHNNMPFPFEIVVVNLLEEESIECAEQWENVILVGNDTYIESSCAYNQGIQAADPEADILLLDSNTDIYENSLFWLKMGLYDSDHIGVAGGQEYEKFVQKNNILIRNFCEFKFYLENSFLLIRREVLNEIGLLDTNFKQKSFCYKDFGLRVCLAGWKNVLCHNGYIHYSDIEKDKYFSAKEINRLIDKDNSMFKEKWNFGIFYDMPSRDKIIGLIEKEKSKDIRVLEIGCGVGETLAKIKFEFPDSEVYGIEFQSETVEIGSKIFNIVQGDIEEFYIPFGNMKFDYIILADTLSYFRNPSKVLKKLRRRLGSNGSFLCSISNFMHISFIHSLLSGEFEYKDKKYLNLFTLNSIRKLCENCEIYIDKLEYIEDISEKIEERGSQKLENISGILECVDKRQLLAYQYVFRGKPCIRNRNFRITAVGMVKNAADIIETYIRANSLIVDNFVLLDNMCSDRTIFILEELKKEGFDIEIIKDEIIEHNQSEKMNKLIYYVNEKYTPDFIIPIDDDECIVPFKDNDTVEKVRDLIQQLPQHNLYYLKWRIYVPDEKDDENVICVAKRQTYCYNDEAECLTKVIIPKGILLDKTFKIVPGNHEGTGDLIKEHILLSFARMAHFPCRSEAQIRSKALTGWTNLLALPGREFGEGYHWELMYLIAKQGKKISLNEMRKMASLYIRFSKEKEVYINRKPVNLPVEAMMIKYTKADEVNPWENYCTNVEILAEKYVELLKEKFI